MPPVAYGCLRDRSEILSRMMINSSFNASSSFRCAFVLQLIGKGINEEDSTSLIVGLWGWRLSRRCDSLPSVNDSRLFPISVILTWRGGHTRSFRRLNPLRNWNCNWVDTWSSLLLVSFTYTGSWVFQRDLDNLCRGRHKQDIAVCVSLTCRWPCRERDQNIDKRFIISTIKRRIISKKIYSHQVLLSSVFHPACWNPNYLECLFVFFLSWPKPLVFKSCVALWRTNSLGPLFKCTKVQE